MLTLKLWMGVMMLMPGSAVTPAFTMVPIAVAAAALFPFVMGNGAANPASVREEGSGMSETSYGKVK